MAKDDPGTIANAKFAQSINVTIDQIQFFFYLHRSGSHSKGGAREKDERREKKRSRDGEREKDRDKDRDKNRDKDKDKGDSHKKASRRSRSKDKQPRSKYLHFVNYFFFRPIETKTEFLMFTRKILGRKIRNGVEVVRMKKRCERKIVAVSAVDRRVDAHHRLRIDAEVVRRTKNDAHLRHVRFDVAERHQMASAIDAHQPTMSTMKI